jgi:hypothetical protein
MKTGRRTDWITFEPIHFKDLGLIAVTKYTEWGYKKL